jgi:beta-N-acetylhexosaminidase
MVRVPAFCAVILLLLSLGLAGCQESTAISTGPPGSQTSRVSAASTTTSATGDTTTTVSLTTSAAESQATAVLKRMTLRQKAAQVLLLEFSGTTTVSPELRTFLTETPPGGLMLLSKNVKGVQQLTSLDAQLQKAAGQGLEGVKLFIAADQEGGAVQRVREGVPNVPAARDVGRSWTPQKAATVAVETAKGLLAQGVNMDLSPVADVVKKPGFLYTRTFSGDPDQVASFVSAITKAYNREGLITVIKHFPGHGSASGNSHTDAIISDASQQEFESTHLVPFQAGIDAGAEGVIIGHIVANVYDPKHPASSSTKVIGDLLRKQMGFTGIAVSDAVEMTAARMESGALGSATAQEAADTAVACLDAGCDLLLSTSTLSRQLVIVDTIVAAVKSGKVSLSRLNEAVLKVLELKTRHGLVTQ